ncbi:MAG: ATP-binding cassette domain-containing protein [Clostridia bacterium]|nr:ATP-binding cassette domain-containing protein [Clostridia bacterium]
MIEINGITKRYGNKMAADNVTFTVNAGEIMGFLGPNGAGKSTTLNILTGFLSATEGSAKIDGIDIFEDPIAAKKKIGFLPEQPPLYLDMTVREYLNFVYELKNCRLDRKKHLKEICDVVKITDVADRVIRNLSKGYRQRVGIAQALIGNPPVLIFDEPTVGLDPKQIIEIRNLIKGLGKEHTIILSTHILSEVQAICDRIVVINKGKVVANEKTENIAHAVEGKRRMTYSICGPQNDVLKLIKSITGVTYAEVIGQRDGDSIAYMIESAENIDIRKPLFFALAEKRWPVIGMDVMGMDLEDVFLALIQDRSTKAKTGKGGKN